jgi:hypothetical protein
MVVGGWRRLVGCADYAQRKVMLAILLLQAKNNNNAPANRQK